MNEQKLKELYWEFASRVAKLEDRVAKHGSSAELQKIQKDLKFLLSKLKRKATESKIDLGAKEDTIFEEKASNDWQQLLELFKLEKSIHRELVNRFNSLKKYPDASQTNVLIEAIQSYCKEELNTEVKDAVVLNKFEEVTGRKIEKENLGIIKNDYKRAFRKALSEGIAAIGNSFQLTIGSPKFVFDGNYIEMEVNSLAILQSSSLPAPIIEQLILRLTTKINSAVDYPKPTEEQLRLILVGAEKYYTNNRKNYANLKLKEDITEEEFAAVAADVDAYTISALIETIVNNAPQYVWEEKQAHVLFEQYYRGNGGLPQYITDDSRTVVDVAVDYIKESGNLPVQFKFDLGNVELFKDKDPSNKDKERPKGLISFGKINAQLSMKGSYVKKPHIEKLTIGDAKENIAEAFFQFGRHTVSFSQIASKVGEIIQKKAKDEFKKNTKITSTFLSGGIVFEPFDGFTVTGNLDLLTIDWGAYYKEVLGRLKNGKDSDDGIVNLTKISLGSVKVKVTLDLLGILDKMQLSKLFLKKGVATLSFSRSIDIHPSLSVEQVSKYIAEKQAEKALEKSTAKLIQDKATEQIGKIADSIKSKGSVIKDGIEDILKKVKPKAAFKKAIDELELERKVANELIKKLKGEAKKNAIRTIQDAGKELGEKVGKGLLKKAALFMVKNGIKIIPVVGQVYAVADALITIWSIGKWAYDNWDMLEDGVNKIMGNLGWEDRVDGFLTDLKNGE